MNFEAKSTGSELVTFVSQMSATGIRITLGLTFYALHEWTQSKYLRYICSTWKRQRRLIAVMSMAVIVCFDPISIDIEIVRAVVTTALCSDWNRGENLSRIEILDGAFDEGVLHVSNIA